MKCVTLTKVIKCHLTMKKALLFVEIKQYLKDSNQLKSIPYISLSNETMGIPYFVLIYLQMFYITSISAHYIHHLSKEHKLCYIIAAELT